MNWTLSPVGFQSGSWLQAQEVSPFRFSTLTYSVAVLPAGIDRGTVMFTVVAGALTVRVMVASARPVLISTPALMV